MWNTLGDLIPDSVKKAGIQKSVSDAMVCEEFGKIASHLIGQAGEHCHAVCVKNRCLWVAVLSNSVSNDLKIYEHDIIKALADKFGKERVVSLRFMA